MTNVGTEANQFHTHRFTVNRSMPRLEMLVLGAGSLIGLGLALLPNSTDWLLALLSRFRSEDALPLWILSPIYQVTAAVGGSIMLSRLIVGLRRRKKDSVWPVWMDADAISTLDEARIYTQTRWSDVRLAQVMKSKDGYALYKLRMELHSNDVTVYPIPSPKDQQFHAELKGYAGPRLSNIIGSSGDLPASSIGMILKARELSERAGDEYLRKCKGTTRSRVGNALNADVPLAVSPEEERAFLQSHPDLAEIESLIHCAIRREEQDSGPTAAYNAANGYNQLGAHYVFVQDFDKAIEAIGTALNRLAALRASSPINPAIVGEIATAQFNLGDVYATLYRRSGSTAYRDSARRHYEESMASDRILNADCSREEQRLKSL